MYAKRLVCESTGFRYPRRIFNASKGPSNQERRWSCNSLRKDWKIEEIDVRGNEYECLWAKVSTTNRDYLLLRFTIHRPLITMNWFLPAIQTELPRLNNGEIFVASQYRQNYRAAEHWQYFDCLIIQTDLPCR